MMEGEQSDRTAGRGMPAGLGTADSAGVIRPPQNATGGGQKPLCIDINILHFTFSEPAQVNDFVPGGL